MKLKFNPCGSCCGCESVSDDFNRASLGSSWIQDTGSWSISSNEATISGAGAMYHTTSSQNFAEAKLSAIAGNSRICIRYTDQDNYLYCDVTTGGFVRLGKRSSGTDTPYGSGASGGPVPGTYLLCYDATNDRLRVTDSTATINESESTSGSPGSGERSGLAVVTPGSHTFDDFRSWKPDSTNADCPECQASCSTCDACDGPADCDTAATITIKFQGWRSVVGFGGLNEPPMSPNGVYILTGGYGLYPTRCVYRFSVSTLIGHNPLAGHVLEYHLNTTASIGNFGIRTSTGILDVPNGMEHGLFIADEYPVFGNPPRSFSCPGSLNTCVDNSLLWISTNRVTDCETDLTGYQLARNMNGFLSFYWQDGATIEVV